VPTDDAVAQGTAVRIDLDAGGWLVTLRGAVSGRRDDPVGVVVALSGTERDKINYLNGFVRGGLLNLREKRRLPIKLAVTYGAAEGPATTFTKDINEEGVFPVHRPAAARDLAGPHAADPARIGRSRCR